MDFSLVSRLPIEKQQQPAMRAIRKFLNSHFDSQVANWRMERLEVDSKSNSDEEFFDCLGEL